MVASPLWGESHAERFGCVDVEYSSLQLATNTRSGVKLTITLLLVQTVHSRCRFNATAPRSEHVRRKWHAATSANELWCYFEEVVVVRS